MARSSVGSWPNLRDEHEERWEAAQRTCRLPRFFVGTTAPPHRLVPAALLLASCGPTLPDSKPLDRDEALDAFQVVDGFRIELFAAESYVLEPVEIAFDENGDLYVAELADHPDDPPSSESPTEQPTHFSRSAPACRGGGPADGMEKFERCVAGAAGTPFARAVPGAPRRASV